MADIVTDQ